MFLETKIPYSKFSRFDAFKRVMKSQPESNYRRKWIIALTILFAITLLLPWTQNIQSNGEVSTLNPEQRPQQINSIIAGRVEKWHVKDGDFVTKGDTLARITEIKDGYLDPSQLIRVDEQIKAKDQSIDFYNDKAQATSSQAVALANSRKLKLSQLLNKIKQYTLLVQSDSISFAASINQLKIADQQSLRQRQLYEAGLKSLVEFEQRQQAYQEAVSKKIISENKFYNSKNELLNIKIEQSAIDQDYAEKILKTTGDRFSSLSEMATAKSEVAKLQNQYENYRIRQNFYVITAPQSGQVIKTSKAGIGEIVKEGEPLLEIVPKIFDVAVKIFVDAVDLPLLNKGQKVALQFDGFPAIVFSGWPNSSYGTFDGKIIAVDPSISVGGKFRAWVVPDKTEKPWPKQLRYGSGAKGIALLKDVPVIYELWRRLNGFPADFYIDKTGKNELKKENNKDEK